MKKKKIHEIKNVSDRFFDLGFIVIRGCQALI